jgi:hypothetical protein
MNTILKSLPLVGLFLLVLVTGCKYEDGPVISLRTTKSRVANSWKWKYAAFNDRNMTAGDTIGAIVYNQCHLGMDKLNRFSVSIATKQVNGYSVDIFQGNWDFGDKNKTITMDFDDPNQPDEVWNVTRLTKDELWYNIEYVNGTTNPDHFYGKLTTDQ